MADPAIPINQQNAFPILTISGAQQASNIQVLGGTVTKYWGPAATGVNSVGATTDANGHVFLVTNFLDMTGCSNVAILIKSNDSAHLIAPTAGAFNIWIQYRLDKLTTMPTSNLLGGGINLAQCGMAQVNTTGFTFSASPAAADEYQLITFGPSSSFGESGPSPSALAIGSDVRFFLSAGTNPVPATRLFLISVWGSA